MGQNDHFCKKTTICVSKILFHGLDYTCQLLSNV